VTGVHRDEFRRARLAIGILDLDVEFERLYDGGAALTVRGCARRACGWGGMVDVNETGDAVRIIL